jgi:hypothetical protein
MTEQCDDLPRIHFLPSIYNPLLSDSPTCVSWLEVKPR